MSEYRIPQKQASAFDLAVLERLGIDPALVVDGSLHISVNSAESHGRIDLTAALPAEELRQMFNDAGKA